MFRVVRNRDTDARHDVVVLLHGLFATTRSMPPASHRLAEHGYKVINWGYPTFWYSIETHTNRLLETLRQLDNNREVRSINFLTHSLGGILARHAIELGELRKLHRMVMLAPPNAGSHLTRLPLGPFAPLIPAIVEISEKADSLPNRLQDLRGVEVGVIAAKSDFIVKTESTFLAQQRDHLVVPGTHFGLPQLEHVLQLATRFLSSGSFAGEFLAAGEIAPRWAA